MIGHADAELGGDYGLISTERKRALSPAACGVLTVALLALVALGSTVMRATTSDPTTNFIYLIGADGTGLEPCTTKLFGQCSGMNFTAPELDKNLFNFSSSGEQFACCPDGSACVKFGPVWGMCMPQWGPAV